MKRKIIILLILLLPLMAAFGDVVLTKDANLPRPGDKLTRQQVEIESIGDSGVNVIWDFSNAILLGANEQVEYISLIDSCIGVVENKTCMKYAVRGDSLLWKGYETRLSILEDSIVGIAMIYPFGYNRQITKRFYLKGRYSATETLNSIGESTIKADGIGVLILPEGDTLKEVLRIHRKERSIISINRKDSCVSINEISCDTITIKEKNYYTWYSLGYRYPIVEVIQDLYFKGLSEVPYKTIEYAYVCSPNEQEFSVRGDCQNQEVRELQKKRFNDKQSSYEVTAQTNSIIAIENVEIITQDSKIELTFRITGFVEKEQIEIILSDVQGIKYGEYSLSSIIGNNRYVIEDVNLPTGKYILYIRYGGSEITKRFLVK